MIIHVQGIIGSDTYLSVQVGQPCATIYLTFQIFTWQKGGIYG